MSNHDSYFHLKKKKKSPVANLLFPPVALPCSAQALQRSSCFLGSTERLAAGLRLQAWLGCTRSSHTDSKWVCV